MPRHCLINSSLAASFPQNFLFALSRAGVCDGLNSRTQSLSAMEVQVNPPPKSCTSPGTLLGREIVTPERGYLSREVFYFPRWWLLFSPFGTGGYFIRSPKPEPPRGFIFFGGGNLFGKGALFGRGFYSREFIYQKHRKLRWKPNSKISIKKYELLVQFWCNAGHPSEWDG